MFSREQFNEWFELTHISRSPAKFDPVKLAWLNQQYLKAAADERLTELVAPLLRKRNCDPARGPELKKVVALLKERATTLEELADAAVLFYRRLEPTAALKTQHYSAEAKPALQTLRRRLGEIEWSREAISQALKEVVSASGLKMPKIAMPLRVMVTGEPQTPSIDATLELIGKSEVLKRLDEGLAAYP
jgi:glutamyl-tRNA synthetase